MPDERPVTRDSLIAYAKANGLTVKEMLALNPKNDPFFVGTDSQIALAEWFAKHWEPIRDRNLHPRGIHYYFVGRGNIPDWKGGVYQNLDSYWNTLAEASKYARYLGLVPQDTIPDRNAREPIIHAYYWNHENPNPDIASLRQKLLSQVGFQPWNPHLLQPYHQEVWIEKSSMGEKLDEVCRRYGANLIQGKGQLSLISVNLFMQRLEASGKPGRVYYIVDWDPQGDSMPTAIARKIEYFNRVVRAQGLDCKLKWLALTKEQVIRYRLPRTPIKDKDLGKRAFEEKYGEGATELDALDAIHPGVLERMVSEQLEAHMDLEAWNAAVAENDRYDAALRREVEKALKGLKWNLKPKRLPDPRGPEPKDDGSEDDWLYDSDRVYDEQLEYYKSKGR